MQRHWEEVAPPLNISLAGFVGFKAKTRAKGGAFDGDEFERAMAEMFG